MRDKQKTRPQSAIKRALFGGGQVSETIGLGLILAVSGGLMDAYSYLGRGGVFANAQTGNILLTSVNLAQGNIAAAMRYMYPVMAFSAGILLAAVLRRKGGGRLGLHWRQTGVAAEAAALIAVAFIPQSCNLAANSLISFACGFQVESFRKIEGNSIATTMCIGNLRSAIHAVAEYGFTGQGRELAQAATYFAVIAAFATGAVAGDWLLAAFGQRAILASSALLMLCFALMFIEPRGGEADKG